MTGHLINSTLRDPYPQAVRGEGVYLIDPQGKRYLDGCSGALVANLGHSATAVTRAMADQAANLAYVYRYHFSSPQAEELADRYCRLTRDPMGMAYFVNSGSEAVEAAVKLARAVHLARGRPERHQVISRWQSYHGITMGALSWSGFTARRAEFLPYLRDFVHIPPAYCYRCWFGRRPGDCGLECAQALEAALLTQDPGTVSAFILEPVSGSSLAAAVPPPAYFKAIREICDRHGVLCIAEEVMTGAGRTGTHFFGSDHFPLAPDLITFGKGVGAGYYPLAGVLVNRSAAEALTEAGGFASGQSHTSHPVGMAAGLAVLDIMEQEDLLPRVAENGAYLGQRLAGLMDRHPCLGDVRGLGLMWGMEFVRDRETREPFDPDRRFHLRVYEAAREQGLLFLPSAGCDRGRRGDIALFGPPLTISREEIDELAGIMDEALGRAEAAEGL